MEVLDSLDLLVPFVMDWHQELEGAVMGFGVGGSWGLVMLLWGSEWEKEIPVTSLLVVSLLLSGLGVGPDLVVVGLEGLSNFVLGLLDKSVHLFVELSDWLNEIGPSHLELIHMGMGNGLVKILHFMEESSLLNVSSSDRFVPFVVESINLSGDISNVDHDSSDLSHSFHISVAGIINNHKLEKVEE